MGTRQASYLLGKPQDWIVHRLAMGHIPQAVRLGKEPRSPWAIPNEVVEELREMIRYKLDDVLAYIVEYKEANDGLSPTSQEMMAALGISSASVVSSLLERLEKKGLVKMHRVGKKSRGIKVVGGQWRWVGR